MLRNLFTAQYYAKPEGEDYIGKLAASNRHAVTAAVGVSMIDVIMVAHPKGFLPTVSRFMYWIGPAVGMATAFTTTTYAATRLRGQDDKWNYVAGSIASAGVFGAWRRHAVLGFSACLFFSIAGAVKKLSIDEGWVFFPQDGLKKHEYGGINIANTDYTLTPVGEKGWTTGKQ